MRDQNRIVLYWSKTFPYDWRRLSSQNWFLMMEALKILNASFYLSEKEVGWKIGEVWHEAKRNSKTLLPEILEQRAEDIVGR